MGFSITSEHITKPAEAAMPFGPGIYNFSVGHIEYKVASTGTRGLHFRLDAEHNDRKYKLWDDVWFTEKEGALKRYTRLLQCLGIDPLDHPEQDTEEQAQALAAEMEKTSGVVRIKPQEGSTYNEPAWYFLPEEAAHETLGPFKQKKRSASKEDSTGIPF